MRTQARQVVTSLVVAVVVMLALAAATAAPAHSRSTSTEQNPDAWLDALEGKHRQLFDTPAPAGGVPLVQLMNYYDTYNTAYGVKDADINGILTFYGSTTLYGVNDATWAKYRLGEFLETNDPSTGKPATTNPWRTAPFALGTTMPRASIEALQKRGATFLLCNNALTHVAGALAKARGLSADAVYADLKANILPGVVVVPAMVVALERAQSRGIAYHR